MVSNTKPAIKMYTTTWCGDCLRSKKLLSDMNVSYEEVNIENNDEAVAQVVKLNNGDRSVPTIVFADDSVLTEPDNDTLKKKIKSLGLI